ncbi:MAG: hypothetical protein ACI8RD_012702 [Bacillariaceae sp.]|jgi:hypothetical protein
MRNTVAKAIDHSTHSFSVLLWCKSFYHAYSRGQISLHGEVNEVLQNLGGLLIISPTYLEQKYKEHLCPYPELPGAVLYSTVTKKRIKMLSFLIWGTV